MATLLPTFEYNGNLYTGWTDEDALADGVPQATIDSALLLVEDAKYKYFYVDSIAGDDTWPGTTKEQPFKTLAAAFALCTDANSCSALISLAADGGYYDLPYATDNRIFSSDTRFAKHTAPTIGAYNGRTEGTPTIRQPSIAIANSPTKLACITVRGGTLDFVGINLETATSIPGGVTLYGMFSSSQIGGFAGYRISGSSTASVNITIGAAQLMNYGNIGLRSLALSYVNILRPTGTRELVDTQYSTLALSVRSCTIPNGTRWADDLIINLYRNGGATSVPPVNCLSSISLTY